ncbi:MAG: phosphoglucosamine mutase [Gammaproteobacteria bacterium]|nr:phosphoglucosamine mutase [Gammaproteobacteria bacterium]
MAVRKFFGTDGIRGKVGVWPITPDFAVKLGWAVGKVLAKKPGARVLIGKDTRRSGYMFESALEAGLSAAGVDVYLLGPMPTPAVAYLTRTFHAQVGIVISASHNPHHDNGIKFFSDAGAKLSDALESEIEEYLDKELKTVDPEFIGKVSRIKDAEGRYIEFCKASLPHFQSFKNLKIVVDCANGATYHIAPQVLQELGADITIIAAAPNGLNINDNVGSTAPQALQEKVLECGADVGIAFDGDGDRVVMVDHLGQIVDGDEILYVLAKDSLLHGRLKGGGVVGTQMSNYGLEVALKKEGIQFARSKVGDRHVMELLQEKNWQLGGESSGHIIWLGSTTTGDGIVAGLQVLAVMQNSGKSLRELLAGMEKFPQVMVNVPTKKTLSEADWLTLNNEVKTIEAKLKDTGRVLLRVSGTEPLIRVMVEGQNQAEVQEYAEYLAGHVRKLTA